MDSVFPEARKTLLEADPEVAGLVEEEKRRQWCASLSRVCTSGVPMWRVAEIEIPQDAASVHLLVRKGSCARLRRKVHAA